jgi:hypothetical protein
MGGRNPESGRSATEKKSDGINDKKMLGLWSKYMNKKVLLTNMEQVS